MSDKTYSLIVKLLGALVMLLTLVSATALVWSGERQRQLMGPLAMDVAADQAVYVLTGAHVLVLGANDELKKQVGLNDVGLGERISDMAVMADGTLFFADPARSAIVRCNPDLHGCAPLVMKAGAGGGQNTLPAPFSQPFKIVVDSGRRLVFAVAPNSPVMFVVALDTGVLAEVKGVSFQTPQDVSIDQLGAVMVADSSAGQVKAIKVDDQFNATVQWELAGKNDVGRPSRAAPMTMQQSPDGHYWLIVADRKLANADVILLSPDRQPIARVVLDTQAVPRAIAVTNKTVVVVDTENVRLLSVSFLGEFLDDFASPTIWTLFAELAEAKQANDRIWAMGWLGMVGVLIGIPGLLFVRWVRFIRRVHEPELPGVRWFAPSRLYSRRMRIAVSVYILLLASFAMAISVIFGGLMLAVQLALAFAVVFALPALGFTYFLVVLASTRIGVSGDQIVLMDHRGRIARGTPKEVLFNGTTAIIDDVAVTIRGGGIGHVYGGLEFDQNVLALLSRADDKKRTFAFEWRLMRIGHPPALVTYLITLPIGIAAIILALAT